MEKPEKNCNCAMIGIQFDAVPAWPRAPSAAALRGRERKAPRRIRKDGNKPLKIAICDDLREERARLIPLLQEYCAANGVLAAFLEYADGESLLSAFSKDAFSLIFLDIYMDGMTGVETARALKAVDPDCVIIFTTTSLEHGADAFDVEAFHYLIKPVDQDKLFAVLNKWRDWLCEAAVVELKCGRAVRSVPIKDILYIDVLGRNSTVHTVSGQIETSMTLAALEGMLPGGQFCRPIRYCLAAMQHIRTVGDDGVSLDNGEKLAVSRLEKENLRQQLASYRLRRLRRR